MVDNRKECINSLCWLMMFYLSCTDFPPVSYNRINQPACKSRAQTQFVHSLFAPTSTTDWVDATLPPSPLHPHHTGKVANYRLHWIFLSGNFSCSPTLTFFSFYLHWLRHSWFPWTTKTKTEATAEDCVVGEINEGRKDVGKSSCFCASTFYRI